MRIPVILGIAGIAASLVVFWSHPQPPAGSAGIVPFQSQYPSLLQRCQDLMPRCSACGLEFDNVRGLSNHRRSNTCKPDPRVTARKDAAMLRRKSELDLQKRSQPDTTPSTTSTALPAENPTAESSTSTLQREDSNMDVDNSDQPPTEPLTTRLSAVEGTSEPPAASSEAQTESTPLFLRFRIPRRLLMRRQNAKAFQDLPPEGISHQPASVEQASQVFRRLRLLMRSMFPTTPNAFGLYRVYFDEAPSVKASEEFEPPNPPDETAMDEHSLGALPTSSHSASTPLTHQTVGTTPSSYAPYPNFSSWLFGRWFWLGGAVKSTQNLDDLMQSVFRHPQFSFPDLLLVRSFANINRALDRQAQMDYEDVDVAGLTGEDRARWKNEPVDINVPFPQRSGATEQSAVFQVPGFIHRSLTDIIRDTIGFSASAAAFQYAPFQQYWKNPFRPNDPDQRVYDEMYSSDAFINAEKELRASPPEPNCTLPRVMASLMFWSDASHLTSFGDSKIWPIYMAFGNQSKYIRGRPTARAMHHVAYLPLLPDSFADWYKRATNGNRGPSKPLITHCRREIVHGAWRILLDEEFLEAYKHGIIIDCADGVRRRVYPRVFTYSADYPEKVLLATIRNLGSCPCPPCLIRKDDIPALDLRLGIDRPRVDTELRRNKIIKVRRMIYQKGAAVNSKGVEGILADQSLVPTKNAFSDKLGVFGVDIFRILTVDLMHDFELGIWKALFTHFLRILHAINPSLVLQLDERFRMVPPFGLDTIRRFHHNVSEMKKLAARDHEDIFTCAYAIFDGLFSDDQVNAAILDLIFNAVHWHSLAKLRMHLDSTLAVFRQVTIDFSGSLRHFKVQICPQFATRETPREARTAAQKAAKAGKSAHPSGSNRRLKDFSLSTFKIHNILHYPTSIPLFGTIDGYSTHHGEREHTRIKSNRYPRVSKSNPHAQIANIEQREHLTQRIGEKTGNLIGEQKDEQYLASLDSGPHHHIASRENRFFNIYKWKQDHASDPAVEHFLVDLRNHILACLQPGGHYEGNRLDFTDVDRSRVLIQHDRIYSHPLARFNYTSYNVRRAQDIINLKTKRDVMVLSNEDPCDNPGVAPHPFWYARVLGIFHVHVKVVGSREPFTRMEFLWVRWFGRDLESPSGWGARRLDRVGFELGRHAFGFLNPAQVLRACHLIPAFAAGRAEPDDTLPTGSLGLDEGGDWAWYYVNRFVDRDMMMRYSGGGVGHCVLASPEDLGAEPLNGERPRQAPFLNSSSFEFQDGDDGDDIGMTADELERVPEDASEEATDSEESEDGDHESDSSDGTGGGDLFDDDE